jgi:hypothetical protein
MENKILITVGHGLPSLIHKRYLPNFKFTPIYEGLKETIEYFEKNYNIIIK